MTCEVVFSEKSLVTFLTDKISAALVRVHVLFKMVGLQKMFVTFRTLYTSFMSV